MGDTEGILFLFLGMWLFVTARQQILFQKRLMTTTQKRKVRRVWEILQSLDD